MTAPEPQSTNNVESVAAGKKLDDAPANQWKLKEAAADANADTDSPAVSASKVEDTGADDFSTTATNFGGAFHHEIVLEPGTIIGGAYRIIEMIGKGGMGQVYLAEHIALAKKCALKVLPSNLVTEKAWKRFQSEAKAISGLDHPNLVRVTDLGIHENALPYFAMEYVNGTSIASLLRKSGRLSQEETVQLLLEVCAGIECAHKQGIVHRDLKPANIMFVEKGATIETSSPGVKILDFGLAKLSQKESTEANLTATGEIFGSPIYMSPEQCLGEATDERTDIYSLGCTAFECLTGRPPFTGTQAIAVMNNKLINPAPSLASAAPGLSFSAGLEQLVGKMLKKDVKERQQSIAALKADLQALHQGRSLPNVDAYQRSDSTNRSNTLADRIRNRAEAQRDLAKSGSSQGPTLRRIRLSIAFIVGFLFVFAFVCGLQGMHEQTKHPNEIGGTTPIMVKAQNGEIIPDYVGPEAWLKRAREAYIERDGMDGVHWNGSRATPSRVSMLTKIINEAQNALIAEGDAAIPACVQDVEDQSPSRTVAIAVLINNGEKSVGPLLGIVERKPFLLSKVANILSNFGQAVGDKLCLMAGSKGDAKERSLGASMLAQLARYHSPETNLQYRKQPLMTESNRTTILRLIKGERDENIRTDLVEALSYFRSPTPEVVSTLSDILKNDPSQKVVQQAIRTLGDMLAGATPSSSATLATTLCNQLTVPGQSEEIRLYILHSLANKRGTFQPDQLSKIKAAGKDGSPRVRDEANQLLDTIKSLGNP